MRDLTPRQQEILLLIKEHINATGFPPTRAEIAERFGFRSPNAAEEHLKALARKGVIELTSGASRGIRLRMLPDSQGNDTASAVQIAISLPLVGRVAAGSPILAQEHIEASYALDPNLFDQAPDYLLKVRGMSMRDAGILDGDLLAVKRLRRRGHSIELLPENPDYAPIVVDARSDDFALEGIGVGLLRGGKAL